jgi:hypothetical protein
MLPTDTSPNHDIELNVNASIKPSVSQSDDNTVTDPPSVPNEVPKTQAHLQLICAGFSFFYAGTNDGTTGPLLPYILQGYHISTSLITVMWVHIAITGLA